VGLVRHARDCGRPPHWGAAKIGADGPFSTLRGERFRDVLVGAPLVPGAGLEPARPCGRGIFVLATAFAAELANSFGVWTFSLPWSGGVTHQTLGRGRQVSTLSLEAPRNQPRRTVAGLEGLSSGLQSPRRVPQWGWFPEFDPIHTGRFRAGCSNYSSPLRLPISPPGHTGGGAIVCDNRLPRSASGIRCGYVLPEGGGREPRSG
jgi:hypothetical protein